MAEQSDERYVVGATKQDYALIHRQESLHEMPPPNNTRDILQRTKVWLRYGLHRAAHAPFRGQELFFVRIHGRSGRRVDFGVEEDYPGACQGDAQVNHGGLLRALDPFHHCYLCSLQKLVENKVSSLPIYSPPKHKYVGFIGRLRLQTSANPSQTISTSLLMSNMNSQPLS
jgi:hypothetical protein